MRLMGIRTPTIDRGTPSFIEQDNIYQIETWYSFNEWKNPEKVADHKALMERFDELVINPLRYNYLSLLEKLELAMKVKEEVWDLIREHGEGRGGKSQEE